jgi:plasmid stabilization system protein ParE
MALKVYLSEKAEINLNEIFEYLLEEFSEIIAKKFISSVDKYLMLLSNFPELCPLTKKKKNIRRCLITKFTIMYYRIIDNEIEIIAFIDARRNIDNQKLI